MLAYDKSILSFLVPFTIPILFSLKILKPKVSNGLPIREQEYS